MKRLLSKREAAKRMHATVRQLDEMLDADIGPPAYQLGNRLGFDPDELDAWLMPGDHHDQGCSAPAIGASWDDLSGFGLASFLLTFGMLSALRGSGVVDDSLIGMLFDEASLTLEEAGTAHPERDGAHRLLQGMLRSGAAFPMRRTRSPFEVN